MALTCIVSVECALQFQNKFLMITRPAGKHAAGMLAFPGGGVEVTDVANGDILLQAAKREVFEEVGLTIIDPVYYATSSYFLLSHNNHPVINVVFYANLVKTTLQLKISTREVPQYAWLTQNEILAAPNCPPWLSISLFELFDTL